MKKKIVSIIVCMLMFVTVSSVTATLNTDFNNIIEIKNNPNLQNKDQWDIQFSIDIEEPTGEGSMVGCEFDGTYFLVSEWGYSGASQPRVVCKLDRDGNLVDSWTPTWLSGGSGGLRDLAYDGQYFYGGNTGNTIYCFDLDGNLIESWSSPSPVRSIAYDEDNDAFWVNNWDSDLMLVDRSGSTLYTITTPPSLYGTAWEKTCDGTPALWLFTGTSTGGPCQVEKYIDLYTGGTNLGNQHQVSDDFDPTGIAGGLFFTEVYEDGFATLGGVVQMTPSTLFGYEMCVTNDPPEIPQTPEGPSEGIVGNELEFSTSTTDPDGDMVAYGWDFDGDFVVDEYTDFFDSGDPVSVTHTYNAPGEYTIRVKAKDTNDLESDWSDPKTVSIVEIPDLDIISISGGLFKVKSEVINNGPVDANGVSWELNLNGGIILLGKTNSGTIDIPAGQTKTIESGIIIGLGSVTINVNLEHPQSSASDSKAAFVLGILII